MYNKDLVLVLADVSFVCPKAEMPYLKVCECHWHIGLTEPA